MQFALKWARTMMRRGSRKGELMDYEVKSDVLVASASVVILTIIGLVVGFDYASWIGLFMMGIGAIIAIFQIVRGPRARKTCGNHELRIECPVENHCIARNDPDYS